MSSVRSMYIMMISVAFIDGALRITNIPTFYLWKDYLGVSPGVNCLLRYFTKLPWCVKPLFAYFSDRHYIWGYRTKIYFIITGLIEIASFLLLGFKVKSVLYSAILVFIHQATIAWRDCLAEGLMVVISNIEDEQNRLKSKFGRPVQSSSQKYVSIIFILRFIGALASSYFAGILLEKFDAHQVLALSSIFPLIATIQAAFFFQEERVFNQKEILSKFKNFSLKEILQFIEDYKITNFLFYIVVMLVWPNTINGLRYFLIDSLHFTTRDVGLLFTLGSFFYVVYMFFMNTFFSHYSLQNYYKSICIMMVFDCIVRYLQMVPDLYSLAFIFATVDQSINNLFYDLPSIPLLAIVCRNCPKSKEATYYGFFVSFSNFFCSLANFTGYMFLNMMDVTETDYTNVNSVNFLCMIWGIMCWSLLKHVQFPKQMVMKGAKEKQVEVEIEKQKSESRDYSDALSEGIDDQNDD